MYYYEDFSLYCDPFSDERYEDSAADTAELQHLNAKYEMYLEICWQCDEPNPMNWTEFIQYQQKISAKHISYEGDLPF
jgi:hypothetical protein